MLSSENLKILLPYCSNINEGMNLYNKIYKKNIDDIVEGFYSDLVDKYPNRKFDFVDVEKEFRDKKRKGDFIIQFEDESYVSFS